MLKIDDLNILNPLRIEYCSPEKNITGAHFDSRKCQAGFLYIALKGQNNDGHDYIQSALNNGAVAAIVDQDYQNKQQFPVIYSENVELFFAKAASLWRKRSSAKVIGITGTNGKTSTKEMLAAILKSKYQTVVTEANFNNQLGVPLTIFKIKPETQIAIIEMGTNHFGEIAFLSKIAKPEIGLITNIGSAHLEEFGNENGVLKEKIELFEYIKRHNGCFLVNNEDELLQNYNYSYNNIKRFGISRKNDFYFDQIDTTAEGLGRFVVQGQEVILNSFGTTACKNALSAMTIGQEVGLSIPEMVTALQGFGSADKRGEILKANNSLIIIDCYNANPSSMQESIRNVLSKDSENTLLVLGDMLELGASSSTKHAELGRFLSNYRYGKILLFGDEMASCKNAILDQINLEYFEKDFDAMQIRFNMLVKDYKKILLKGSRGMRLERLLENIDLAAK